MLALAIGFLLGGRLGDTDKMIHIVPRATKQLQPLDEILSYVDHHYVDDVDIHQLTEDAIRMVVDSLDRHSRYMSAEELKDYTLRMSGNYVGLGIHFRMIKDTPVVTHIYESSPANSSGLLVGDQMIMRDTTPLTQDSMNYLDVVDLLKGEQGASIDLQIRRCGEPMRISVKRNKVAIPSVSEAIELDTGVFYVAIHHFNSNTSTEFLDALEPYQESRRLKDLILDLRGNPGGYLDEAIQILNQFISSKGELLLYTEGENSERKEYKAMGKSYLEVDDLVVLMDYNSASASEIVAGAVQDLDRGIVIGRRSFGKGLVQEQYPLSSGGALKLTVARYYTPSGRLIQSDETLRIDDTIGDEWSSRWERGELCIPDRMPLTDSVPFCSTYGLLRYGGRGIVPDLFVPLDSAEVRWAEDTDVWDYIEGAGYQAYTDDRCGRTSSTRGILDHMMAKGLGDEPISSEVLTPYLEESFIEDVPVMIQAIRDRYLHGRTAWQKQMLTIDDDIIVALDHLRSLNTESMPASPYAEHEE